MSRVDYFGIEQVATHQSNDTKYYFNPPVNYVSNLGTRFYRVLIGDWEKGGARYEIKNWFVQEWCTPSHGWFCWMVSLGSNHGYGQTHMCKKRKAQ